MKKHFNKLAIFTALVLISSVPFSNDVFADPEKKAKPALISHQDNSVDGRASKSDQQTASNT